MSTFSSTNTGIVLSSISQNPATIVLGAYVTNTTTSHNGDAVYGSAAAFWNVSNYGTVEANGPAIGVLLAAGGIITNASGALISGGLNGVKISGTVGNVENSGTIRTTATTAGDAIFLTNGGFVNNQRLVIGKGGIALFNAGTVSNSGTIQATAATFYAGVYSQGGTVANSGLITGVASGIFIGGSRGVVTNLGTIEATGLGLLPPHYTYVSVGARLAAGGTLTNGQSGSAAGLIQGGGTGVELDTTAATVVNFGTIKAFGTGGPTYDSAGIFLTAKGVVTNNGMISGNVGVGIYQGGGTVSNFGTIAGVHRGAIVDNGGGTMINNGLITAMNWIGPGLTAASGAVASGIYLIGGGYFNNHGTINDAGTKTDGVLVSGSGSFVNGPTIGLLQGGLVGVEFDGSVGSGINFGTIQGSGTASIGVYLAAGGTIVNNVGAVITAVQRGVQIGQSSGSVNNSGTITATGTNGIGVYLRAGGTVVNSGLINGTIDGIKIGSTAGTVSNVGTVIAAATDGTGVYLTSGNVTNSGTVISGANGTAVYIRSGTFFNSGLVVGKVAGIAISQGTSAGGSPQVAVSGTVIGATGVNVASSTTSQQLSVNGVVIGTNGTGVYFASGGVITNSGVGYLLGASGGLVIRGNRGTVLNTGAIKGGTAVTGVAGNGFAFAFTAGTSGYGVSLAAGGIVANSLNGATGGYIAGVIAGVAIGGGAGTVINSGTVKGGSGIVIASGSTTTVSNAGTIVGTSGSAVSLGGGSNRLVLAPGAVFQGKADGGGGKSVVEVTLSLAGLGAIGRADTAALTVNISLGSVSNFSALQIDPGATANTDGSISFDTLVNQGQINLAATDSLVIGTVAAAPTGGTIDLKSGGSVHITGAVAAGQTVLFRPPDGTLTLDLPEQFAGAITQFAAGDTIDLPLGNASLQQYDGAVLSFSYNGVTVAWQLSTTAVIPQFLFIPDGQGGTDIFVSDACFCRGTLILTERGEVPVEDLTVGERVRTLSGGLKPIVWIGFGRDLVTRRNSLARPIIVRRGALAEGVPHRDLYLTHGHALYVDDVLIPVENLINHHSILWDESARIVEFYHLELADHDVVLANGAPAESYYDASNRALFHNTRPGSAPGEAMPTYAPVLNGGAVVEYAWAKLYKRAGGGTEADTTDDPDLHLAVGGGRLGPAIVEDDTYRFEFSSPPTEALSLRSRSGVPSLLGITAHDHRRLGIAIRRIVISQPGITTVIEHDALVLATGGCHPAEQGYSWTDGELTLPAHLFAHLTGPFALAVHIERPGMRYPIATIKAAAA